MIDINEVQCVKWVKLMDENGYGKFFVGYGVYLRIFSFFY